MSLDYFKFGPQIDISLLTPEQAKAFFGEPIYEAWRSTFGAHRIDERAQISLRVVKVDRQKRTVEIEFE